MKVEKLIQLLEVKKSAENLTDEEIFGLANIGDKTILSDPRVSKIKNSDGESPLHILAFRKVKEILNHPDVAKIKNVHGDTPLHYLSSTGVMEVLDHPKAGVLRGRFGKTPFDLVTTFWNFSKSQINKLYQQWQDKFQSLPKTTKPKIEID